MREIRFQAYGHLITEDKGYRMFEVDGFESYSGQLMPTYRGEIICDHSLRQYTGKKDIDGKKVYLGDIMSLEVKPDIIVKIVWNEDTSSFASITSGSDAVMSDHLYGIEWCRVIGNIYEDKNLLEESK